MTYHSQFSFLEFSAVRQAGHSSVEKAVLAVLGPLIKVALRRGVAHGRFSDLAKEAYVDVARDSFSASGRKPSASGISIVTGLTRREVARLLKKEGVVSQDSPRTRFNRAARVLGAWSTDSNYLDGRGGPASLSFESGDDGPSITTLVRDHGADVPPRAVLDELLSVGAVQQLKSGRFRPLQRSYVPRSGEDAKLEILGADVADLILSIDHNLDPESDAPYYQRKVAYDNLPASYLPKLRAIVNKEAQRFLERLNRDMSKSDADVAPETKSDRLLPERHRAMIGVYFYQDEYDDAE